MASISKRGAVWTVRYRVEDATGRVVQKRVSGFATRGEAEAEARKLEAASQAGVDVHGGSHSCGYWMDRWLAESCEGRLEDTTLCKYRAAVDILRTLPIIDYPVKRLNKQTVAQLTEQLRTRDDTPRTVRTALETTEPLRFALAWAEREGYIPHNPIKGSRLPKVDSGPKVFLDDTDMLALLEEAQRVTVSCNKKRITGGQYYIPILLALYGGLRRQEVAALQWSSVDFKRRTITIVAAHSATMEGDRVVKGPKSKTSRRTITMPRFVMDELQAAPKRSAYVCAKPDGSLYALHTLSRAVRRLVARINKQRAEAGETLMPEVNFHGLRHTHAAYLIRLGVNAKVIQERLGHASIKVTLDTYGHLMEGMQETAASAMDRDISNGKVGTKVGTEGTQSGRKTAV